VSPTGRPEGEHRSAQRDGSVVSWRGELAGGATSAAVGVTLALSTGLIAFAPLGPAFAAIGVEAAFAAAIAGNVVATICGGTVLGGSGPRASVALVTAGLVASLAQDPAIAPSVHGASRLLALTATTVALAGLLQVLFGLLRLGKVVRFVPYPVVAGFMGGIAVLIVLAQLPHLAGVAQPGRPTLAQFAHWQPWTAALGVGTAAFIVAIGARTRPVPGLAVGLAAGTLAYHGVAALAPGAVLGPVLGHFDPLLPVPAVARSLQELWANGVLASHAREVVVTAFVIAVTGSLDSLLASVAVDAKTAGRHQPNRQLIGQGLGNIVSALFAGIPVAYSFARVSPAYDAGARSRAAELVASSLLLLGLFAGHAVVAAVPITVVAGVMLVVALSLVDNWTRQLFGQLREAGGNREIAFPLATVVAVASVTIFVNFVAAITVGVVLAMALFIATMHHSLVRSTRDGTAVASRRIYPPAQAAALRRLGTRTVVLDLDGALFFGSGDRLSDEVERRAGAVDALILNFARVTAIDATAAQMLAALDRRLQSRGIALLLAHVPQGGKLAQVLEHAAHSGRRLAERCFDDLDHALEAAELEQLGRQGLLPPDVEVPVEAFALFAGLSADEVAYVMSRLERHELARGTVVIREGDAGDRMFLLGRGAVRIVATDRHEAGREHRIATLSAGALFGEQAIIGGGPRTADAIADTDIVVHVLTQAALSDIAANRPALAAGLMANLAKQLSERLRLTTFALRAS
jgi:SulP family sulfate permease